MNTSHLLKILPHLQGVKSLVLGDVMLDKYTWGDVVRVSPEAPVPVLRVKSRESRLGGAGNVCNMLRGLESDVTCVGVIGDDAAGRELRGLLSDVGVDCQTITSSLTSTTVKERLLGQAHNKQANHLLRVDDEAGGPLPDDHDQQLIDAVTRLLPDQDVLLISDYGKGACSPRVVQAAIQSANRAGVFVIVDPAPGADYEIYRGADVVKPNRKEASQATGLPILDRDTALKVAERLCESFDLRAAVVTLDRDGIALANRQGERLLAPTQAKSVCDVTGAGDAVFAMLAASLARATAGNHLLQLCNLIGELAVERMGTSQITLNDLRNHLLAGSGITTLEQTAERLRQYRLQGRRVVFTNGCFDLMHIGHARYLAEAAEMGDVLVVGLNSDASVRRLKGDQRPVIGENDRGAMLAALRCVDHVVIYDEDTPHRVLETLRPDVLVKGGTYTPEQVVGREVVLQYGGEVRVTGQTRGVSTTHIIESIQGKPAEDDASNAESHPSQQRRVA